MPDVALFIDWENVYYTLRQHYEGRLPSSLAVLQAILKKAAEFGTVRVKQAIFGQEVAAQDETLLMALEFTGIEPIAVAQRMSGRLLKGRADSVLIVRALRMLYKERPDVSAWFIVSGDRDLNALCKALKDEDKQVYLVAGDRSLANELRESPYLRDDVFLLEELLPEMTRATPVTAQPAEAASRTGRGRRGGRGRGKGLAVAVANASGHVGASQTYMVPAPIVPAGAPTAEKEQRRLAVLLLDQLVATDAEDMARDEFVESVVPASDREGRKALDALIDAGVEQRHLLARVKGRTRAKGKLRLRANFGSPLVAETVFQLVRLLRRIDTVAGKENRRIPVVEAVFDPLSRAEHPGTVQGRAQRRALLETLFSIAEERGVVTTEHVERDRVSVAMCWLETAHPLVAYSRRRGASLFLLLNFATAFAEDAEERDWTNVSLVPELLARAEGDSLESTLRDLTSAGAIRLEERGKRRRTGYVLDREHPLVRAVLGSWERVEPAPAEAAPPPRKRGGRRGSRGGRGRRRRSRESTAAQAEEPQTS